MSPRKITKALCKATKWILLLLVVTFLCFRFREKEQQTKGAYKLLQEYLNKGLLQAPPARPVVCQPRNVFLLIMVPSAVSNFEQRRVIRKTWGNITTEPSVLLRFVLGKSTMHELQSLAETENSVYNDILFTNILETYENLLHKSIALLRWASFYCQGVQYLLKIDDDMFLNLPRLLNDLRRNPKLNTISGCRVSGASPFRTLFSKWRISRKQYQKDVYPDYIAGTAYLISGDIISKLYNATRRVPYFVFEDVYITGMCRKHIGAVASVHREFSCGFRDKGPCGKNFRYHITGHHYRPTEIQRMWSELQDRWSNCRLADAYLIHQLIYVSQQLMFL